MGQGRFWAKRSVAGINYITVHHTASLATGTDDQIMQNEANHHIDTNGWAGLSYHFFITKNGNIYQINNLDDWTYHDAVNVDSIGVVLAGYFHSPHNENPTDAQLKSLRYLLDELCTQHSEFPADESKVVPHRMRTQTACCGDNFVGFVNDYRNKLGKVDWGNYTPTPPPTSDWKKKYEDEVNMHTATKEAFKKYKADAELDKQNAVKDAVKKLNDKIDAAQKV